MNPDTTSIKSAKSASLSSPAEDNKLVLTVQILSVSALLMILKLNLLPALLSGLLIYNLVQISTPQLSRIGIVPSVGKIVTLTSIAIIVMTAIALCMIGLASLLNNGSGGLVALLQKMADTVDSARSHLPAYIQDYLPTNVRDIQIATASWLREHALQLSHIGRTIGVSIVYILTGMIIGGMIAFSRRHQTLKPARLTSVLVERTALLSTAFRRVVFSQIKISAINTFLTAIFLVGILPALGIVLPLTKIMIAVTFIVGLLPVLGNLISNTVIVLICLSVSPPTAIGALLFLVVIHKLEYFLNAHIISSHISARAWEILLAMLVMESAFGISGMIAAPIYYAYIKNELTVRKFI